MPSPPESLPPPGPLAVAVGACRMAAAAGVLLAGAVAVTAAALWPTAPGRTRPAQRLGTVLARALLAAAGVRVRTDSRGALAQHRGFVFYNHVSYLDPVVLAAVAPMRFLATAGVRRLPVFGPVATALGTLYVHRGQSASRAAARRALVRSVRQSTVPVALAPEGQIGPGPGVLPFRHGAFEVAAQADVPVHLVALRFTPPAYTAWGDGEPLPRAFWRLCARTGPVDAVVDVVGRLDADCELAASERALRAEVLFNQELQKATPFV